MCGLLCGAPKLDVVRRSGMVDLLSGTIHTSTCYGCYSGELRVNTLNSVTATLVDNYIHHRGYLLKMPNT